MRTLSVFFLSTFVSLCNGQTFSFSPAPGSPITATTSLKGLTAADLNKDGHVDLVACNAYYTQLHVYLGNGNGQFTLSTGAPIPLSSGPMAAAVADYNGDGNPDIATANYMAGNVSVLLGNGTGSFSHASGSPITTGANPYYVETADFNLDGKMDLISSSVNASAVYLYHGLGNGTFTLAPGFPLAAPGMPYYVTSGLFNNDLLPDFVVLNHNSAQANIYLGTTAGTFVTAPGSPLSTGSQPRTIRISDLDNDGDSDLVISCAAGKAVKVFLGSSTGSFVTAPGSPISIGMDTYMSAVADFDLDGKKDLVVSGHNNAAHILRGGGNGSFSASGTTITMGYAPQPVCTADFDEDGRPDFAMGDFWGNELNIMLNRACNLSSGISHVVGQGGLVTFNSTGTGTVTATTYSWTSSTGIFGSGSSAVHSFSPGIHTVTLVTSNNFPGGACNYTSTSTFSVEGCKLAGGIVHAFAGNGQVNFAASMSGTVSGTTYSWNFAGMGTALGAAASYTFPPGVYIVTLTVNNHFTGFQCQDTYTVAVTVDGEVTGISENENEIAVYPNPTAGDLQVQCGSCTGGRLFLFDVAGRNVYTHTLERSSENISLSELPDGIYFYRMEDEGLELTSGKLLLRR